MTEDFNLRDDLKAAVAERLRLECELAEARAKLDDAVLQIGRLQGHKASAEVQIEALRAEIRTLRNAIAEQPPSDGGGFDPIMADRSRLREALIEVRGKVGSFMPPTVVRQQTFAIIDAALGPLPTNNCSENQHGT